MNRLEAAHWFLDYGIMLSIVIATTIWKAGYWPLPLTHTAIGAWVGIFVFAIWQAVKYFY